MKEGSTVPRRGQISKRDVLPDPLYNSKLVTKLVNNVMYDGKKGVAQKIVYDAFKVVEEKSGKGALEAFTAALDNIMPVLEVKARRVGRLDLSGSDGGPCREKADPRSPLARVLCKDPRRKDHG